MKILHANVTVHLVVNQAFEGDDHVYLENTVDEMLCDLPLDVERYDFTIDNVEIEEREEN